MAKDKKAAKELTMEEKLAQAFVPVEEQPYKIPENWCWTTIDKVTYHISDGSHNPPINSEKGIPLLSAANIHNGIIDFESANRWITEKDWEYANKRTKIELNDVLVTIVATIGRVAIVKSNKKFALQRSVAVLKPIINSDFLAYYLESPFVQSFMTNNAKGTAQKGFYLKTLAQMPCIIAPTTEQQCIVDHIKSIFAKLDEAKEKAQAVVDSFELRKSAILHKAFTGELTKQWREESGLDMTGWRSLKLSDIFDVRDGTHDSPQYYDTGYPLITSKNLKNGRITEQDIKFISCEDYKKINERSKVSVGDILFAMIGTIGNPTVIQTEPNFAIKNVALFKNVGKANSYYVKYYLESRYVIDKMRREAKGSTQKFVSLGYLREFPIDIPTKEEQEKIVCVINEIFSKEWQVKEEAENIIDKIDIMKKSVLARAFRGELGRNNLMEGSSLEVLKMVLQRKK